MNIIRKRKSKSKEEYIVSASTSNLKQEIILICVYDEQPIAGQDIQYQAPDSRSTYTTPFN